MSQSEGAVMSLRAFKATRQAQDEMSWPFPPGTARRLLCSHHWRVDGLVVPPTASEGPPFLGAIWSRKMARILVAVAIMTAGALFTVFAAVMTVSYEINESCTDQMAREGNC